MKANMRAIFPGNMYVDVLHYGEHREKASDTRHVTRSGTGLVVMQATNDNRLKLQPAVA